MGPVVGVGRYDVGVAVDEQPGPRAVLALDAGDGRGAALVGLEDLRLQADLGELLRNVLGGGPLTRARVIAVVAGIHPDQIPAQIDDLVLAGDRTARLRLAHTASSGFTAAASRTPGEHGPQRAPPPSSTRHRLRPRAQYSRHALVTAPRPANSAGDRPPAKVCYCFPRRNGPGRTDRHLVRVAEWQTR